MKTKLGSTLIWIVLASAGCSDGRSGSPTALDPTPPVQLPVAVEDGWSLDQTFVSVDGPEDHCLVRDRALDIGSGWTDQPLALTIRGDQVELSYVCGDLLWCEYAGTLDGNALFARGAPWSGTWKCSSGESFTYEGSSDLTGTFSSDRRRLDAVERWVYDTAEGEVVVTLAFVAQKRGG